MVDECFVCGDGEDQSVCMVKLPCGQHTACPSCLKKCFDQAQQVQSNYPPRCCQPINIELFGFLVPQPYLQKYRQRVKEFNTPPADRIYCRQCQTFVEQPASKNLPAVCNKCHIAVCAKCGGKEHKEAYICSPEKIDSELQELIKKEGWKCCPNCSAVIELREACNHVTCGYCSHAICYSCGLKWPCPSGCPPYGKATQRAAATATQHVNQAPVPANKRKQVPQRYMNAQNAPVPLPPDDPRGPAAAPGALLTRRQVVRMEEAALAQIATFLSLGLPVPRHLQEFLTVMAPTQDPANLNQGEFNEEDEGDSASDDDRDTEEASQEDGEGEPGLEWDGEHDPADEDDEFDFDEAHESDDEADPNDADGGQDEEGDLMDLSG